MQGVTGPVVGTKRKEWQVGSGQHPPQGTFLSPPSPYIFPLTTPPRFLPAAREFVGSLLADLAKNKAFVDLLQAGPRTMSDHAHQGKSAPMAPPSVVVPTPSMTSTTSTPRPRVAQQWLDILTDILTAVELWVAVQSPHLGRWTPLQLQMVWSFALTVDKAMLALSADDSDREFCESLVRSACTLAFQEHPADMAPPKVAFPPHQCRWFAQFSRHLAHAWLSNAAADRLMLITLLARHPGAVTPQSGPSSSLAAAPSSSSSSSSSSLLSLSSSSPTKTSAAVNASALARRCDLEQFAQQHARLPTLVSLHTRLMALPHAPASTDAAAVPAIVPPLPLYLDGASLAAGHGRTSMAAAALPLWNASTQVALRPASGGKTMTSSDETAEAVAIDESSVFCDAVAHVLLRRCMEVTEGLALPDARSFVDAFALSCVGAAQNCTRLAVLLRAYVLSFKPLDNLPLLRPLTPPDQPSMQPLEVPLPRASAWGFDLHLASFEHGLAEVIPQCRGLMERIILEVAQVCCGAGVVVARQEAARLFTRVFVCV
jgi:hypothetical protein